MNNRYQITEETLEYLKKIVPKHTDDDHSRMAEDDRDTLRAIDKVLRILKSESEYQEDQETHSEVTVEMEIGREISLAEWARAHKIDESTARQKARRGGFKTARKVGRDWLIRETEENPDGRRKK